VPEVWSPEALVAEARRQQELRKGDDLASATPWARRLGWQLRLVGAALDVVGPGPYTIVARPEEVYVFNAQGYRRSFRHTTLERQAAVAPEFRGQPTMCPVCEEPESLVPLLHDLAGEDLLGASTEAGGPARASHRCRLCGASVRLAAPRA
jgi:hypothetical protein